MFNEAFLMHMSTSPQYAIIASCDVAAAMMEPPGGHRPGGGVHRGGPRLPPRHAQGGRGLEESWWFKVWGPDELARRASASARTGSCAPASAGTASATSPPASTCSTPSRPPSSPPGWTWTATSADWGIPAAIVTSYLVEHGIIVEKTGLYSFFIMFTIGITKGRWNTMVTELQQFKDDYDHNRPLWRVLPDFVAKQPRYERIGLKDLCDQIHAVYREHDIPRLTTEMYLSEMAPAMRPADAFARMAHREIERVEIDHLEGRITAILLTPYPPGIPLLIPGERFNATIVRYLQFARAFNDKFPGFETDIHGLVKESVDGRVRYYVDCVS